MAMSILYCGSFIETPGQAGPAWPRGPGACMSHAPVAMSHEPLIIVELVHQRAFAHSQSELMLKRSPWVANCFITREPPLPRLEASRSVSRTLANWFRIFF